MAAQDQAPIGSGFHAKSSAADVVRGVDLSGRNVIVTGGYSGIGLETVRALASAGARVTVPARRAGVAAEALAPVAGEIEIASMDLGDVASVRKFADDYLETGRDLDILINNAGIMATPFGRVGKGWETQFGTNHLGHMALALKLAPALQAAEGARVVALSSTGHIRSDVIWDDPHYTARPYDKWEAYGQAKSANALFALGVDLLGREVGVRAFSVHPGGIFTPLQRHLTDEEMAALGWKNADGTIPPAVQAMFKTPEQGASTTVWAATSPQLAGKGGVYCEDCDIARMAGPDSQRWEHAREWIADDARAQRLWDMSEKMLADA
ncbi:MAG: SDR family NAD(P)-dependent oxidoreductase [Hyphomonas sp.]|uniref:oxidoreductase n=1 Tax=Hyphomonas sp. TaxID=87 RepID=UPI0017D59F74|nr:oxidoreductase [Hyphomonas sp.]MBU3921527.1 SDR family NAD(P)-dependent oxidoreductase [Alphaproteobacteria bacterium]MBA3068379.1 SDR family NAD(P)-dependent oxidoreductase [Hyphomonas sp.]MBU4060754.1 SDR family NAD(P)-dependent oxidoreductase [Alphaproteobacteria bacterium]MBU4164738.1 SDR family NAD(P)-dependent oxidoreductase [Alphaproteobacteria bacterium]MBU4568306.1 SDR family NAD(P)-dependent oxidoreductase [Alphaproteobacteria bacterium]